MSNFRKVSEKRLSRLLGPKGFRRGLHRNVGFAWSRWNVSLDVYEWMFVEFAGKRSEAVIASIGVGVTGVISYGEIQELLLQVADVKELVDEHGFWVPGRGRSIIDSVRVAKSWEVQLAGIAPGAALSHSQLHANELLQRTAKARRRTIELVRLVDSSKSLYQQIQEFVSRHGATYRREAERLAEWPGVMQVADAEELYLLACCVVLTGEQGAEFFGRDPLRDDDLMWQIQLVADGVLLRARSQGEELISET